MNEQQIKEKIQQAINAEEIHVDGDGYHFIVTVIADAFEGQPSVKRQQSVYKTLNADIMSGELHAVTIKAYTPSEYKEK